MECVPGSGAPPSSVPSASSGHDHTDLQLPGGQSTLRAAFFPLLLSHSVDRSIGLWGRSGVSGWAGGGASGWAGGGASGSAGGGAAGWAGIYWTGQGVGLGLGVCWAGSGPELIAGLGLTWLGLGAGQGAAAGWRGPWPQRSSWRAGLCSDHLWSPRATAGTGRAVQGAEAARCALPFS